MRPLLLDGTVANVPLMGGMIGAAAMTRPRDQWHGGAGPLPESFYAQAAAELGVGYWNLRLALYGPEAIVERPARPGHGRRSRPACRAPEVTARKIAGADVSEQTVTSHPERVQAGIPGLALLDSLQWWGGIGGHLDFSPVAPLTGRARPGADDAAAAGDRAGGPGLPGPARS